MKKECHTGFKEIVLVHERQQRLVDEALERSVQETKASGMQGEALPYMLRNDSGLTVILLACFILFSYALRNSKKYLWQRIHSFFVYRERNSLFDEISGTDFKYILLLGMITCICGGFCLYDYFLSLHPLLFRLTPHLLLIGIYIGSCLLLAGSKWVGYSFINWIFFNKEKNKLWIETYFDVLAGSCFLLFPAVLLIFYTDLSPSSAKLLVLIILSFAKILLFYKCIRNFFSRFHGAFHLILYFCTLEIVPDLFLWKGIEKINNILVLNF